LTPPAPQGYAIIPNIVWDNIGELKPIKVKPLDQPTPPAPQEYAIIPNIIWDNIGDLKPIKTKPLEPPAQIPQPFVAAINIPSDFWDFTGDIKPIRIKQPIDNTIWPPFASAIIPNVVWENVGEIRPIRIRRLEPPVQIPQPYAVIVNIPTNFWDFT